MAIRAEMVLLREALESYMAPEVATAVLFDALERSGGPPPDSLEGTRAFATGPLAEAVRGRVEPRAASEIITDIDALFERAIDGDGVALDVDIELGDEHDEADSDEKTTHVMQVVRAPVPVVVLAGSEAFAERLVICLGEDRVATASVGDVTALRKTVFSHTPLIVLVDGVTPAGIDAHSLCSALRGLPSNALPVLWGAETPWARMVVPLLDKAGANVLTLSRAEGIEPLLDLVLSRYRGDA